MKQGESVAAVLGSGAMVIRECSRSETLRLPALTLMYPADYGYVQNGGCSDQAVIDTPARSFEISNSVQVRQLYEFLKDYFEADAGGWEGEKK